MLRRDVKPYPLGRMDGLFRALTLPVVWEALGVVGRGNRVTKIMVQYNSMT